jgi:membrane protease YdiL (CAAX protease family)
MEQETFSPFIPKQSSPPELGWGWPAVGWTLALLIGGGAALIIAMRSVVALGAGQPETGLVGPLAYTLGSGIYLLLIAGVYLFAARRAGWAALGLRQANLLDYLLVLPLYVLGTIGLVAANLIVVQLTGIQENPQVDALSGGQALSPTQLFMLLILVAGLAPLAEELFFRGMLYPLLRRRLGPAAAISINAGLFALAHFIPILLPGLFIIGLALAYLRERSGSIWPCVLYHVIQNSIALLAINTVLNNT